LGYDEKTAKEKIAVLVVEDIFKAMHGQAFDEEDYCRRLAEIK
jgi:hypothetical protein